MSNHSIYDTYIHDDSIKIINNSIFDLNFAEIPLCYLSRKPPTGINRIQIAYDDYISYMGEKIHRKFYVQSLALQDPKKIEYMNKIGKFSMDNIHIGFGGPITLDIIYELHQLWLEQGLKEPFIDINSYPDFIRRLGWTKSGKTYQLLDFHLQSLFSIRVHAENSLFQGKNKPCASMSFYLFPSLNNTYPDNPTQKQTIIGIDPSYYKTIKKNCIMVVPFNSDFYYSLKPLEKRLALYLSKIFNPRIHPENKPDTWTRNILQFARQMPLLSTDYKIIARTFRRSLNGLIEKKFPFLERYKICDKKITFICEQPVEFETHINVNKFVDQSDTISKLKKKPSYEIDNIVNDISNTFNDKESIPFYHKIATTVKNDLIYQALSTAKQEGKDPKKYFTHLIKKYIH